MSKGRASTLISLFLTIGLIWAAINWQSLRDKAALSWVNPNAEIEAIAERTTMTEKGKDIFFVTNPTIDDREEFNTKCPQKEAGLNVLGCYQGNFISTGSISLFRIEDPRLVDEIDVTAAHEMLHAAYDRLNLLERRNLEQQLTDAVAKIPIGQLTDVIKGYVTDGNFSELHSHLGTEYLDLSAELEDHYRKYFADRQRIVQVHLGNDSLFAACEQDGKSQRASVDSTKSAIASSRAQLDSTRAQMDRHLAAGETEQYNALVPRYNQLVILHNSTVNRYNSLIRSYNSLVDRCNALNLSFDSSINTVQTAPSR